MALQCPQCGTDILAENINMQEMVALCHTCDLVFHIKDHIPRRKGKHRDLPMPKNIQVEETDEQLSIAYRMVYSGGAMLGFTISMLSSVLLPLAFIIILSTKSNIQAFPMLLIGAGILWSWYLAAAFINTTTRITVTEDVLAVKSGPLPLPIKDDKVIPTDAITRLYREEVTDPFPSNNVRAELYNGDQLKVVTSLPAEHAIYIARTIDHYIQSGISDVTALADEFYDDEFYDEDERDSIVNLQAETKQYG